MQRAGVVWLHRKDLAVERFGFRQTPGPMMLKRDLKRLWNRHSLNYPTFHIAHAVLSHGFVGNGILSHLVPVISFRCVVEKFARGRRGVGTWT